MDKFIRGVSCLVLFVNELGRGALQCRMGRSGCRLTVDGLRLLPYNVIARCDAGWVVTVVG